MLMFQTSKHNLSSNNKQSDQVVLLDFDHDCFSFTLLHPVALVLQYASSVSV